MKNSMSPRTNQFAPPVSTTETFNPPAKVTDDLTAKMTVRMTAELHKSVKMLAIERGVSVQDLVNTLLQREVDSAAQ